MRISQREARRLQKLVRAYKQADEQMRRSWAQEYFGATEIARISWGPIDAIPVAVRTARKLNHAVVVIGNDEGMVRFMALPHPKVSA